MISLFLGLCYLVLIWPFKLLFRLLLLPVHLVRLVLGLPSAASGGPADDDDDTMDDFLDWVEAYECLTEDDRD